MIDRRQVLLSAPCLAAAGGAYALAPRSRLTLLGDLKMADIIPTKFGGWQSQAVDSLVQAETEGRLASKLYSEMVSRIYVDPDKGAAVMMLVAYGDTQSDLLQLHRPEACYPAIGFRLTLSERTSIPLSGDVALPGRHVVAERSDRIEHIVYWTRLGEYLPTSAGEQRKDRLLTAMGGEIPDGGLFRLSMLGDPQLALGTLQKFVADLISAVPPKRRRALIGTGLADRLSV